MAQALPFIAAGAAVLGTGIAMAGAKRQGNVAAQLANRRAEQLAQQKVAVEEDIVQESQAEDLRRQLIAREGAQEGGGIKVALASNGVLLEPGDTAFDIFQDSRDETRFKMLLSAQRSDMRKRNLAIEANTIEGNIGATRFEAEEARSAANIQMASTALSGVSSLSSKFTFDDAGDFKFRTV